MFALFLFLKQTERMNVLLLVLVAPLVAAQIQSGSNVDYKIPADSTSEALIVDIRGSGTLDLSNLQIDPIATNSGGDGDEILSLQAAVIQLHRLKKNDESSNEDRIVSAGLGTYGSDGKYYTCCSESAVYAEGCTEEELGQLIVPADADVRSVEVSLGNGNRTDADSSNSTGSFGRGGMVWFRTTSHAALVFGNCQSSSDVGATLHVRGKVTWSSFAVSDMLPFYVVMTLFHVGLCLWYGTLMRKNKETRIQVEKWIMFTIALAALTAVFETLKLVTETYLSNEIMFIKITSLLLSLTRHSVTRCLYLVLSLGLGVATKSLSKVITFLIAVFVAVDLFLLWSMHMAFYMNIHLQIPFSRNLVRIMEYIFTFWIPIALCRTMYYLRLYEENLKLIRYKWFLGIYFLTATLSFLERFAWGPGRFRSSAFREANDIIYLVPLACVAILWKPNPNQQSYSYELLDDDEEDACNDLELTENVDEGNIKEKENQLV